MQQNIAAIASNESIRTLGFPFLYSSWKGLSCFSVNYPVAEQVNQKILCSLPHEYSTYEDANRLGPTTIKAKIASSSYGVWPKNWNDNLPQLYRNGMGIL